MSAVEPLTLDEITDEVRAALLPRAPELGLDAAALHLEYVLNWGGFCSTHFRVSDGRQQLHLKLSADPEHLARLQRWRRLRSRLEERYAAPPLLGWLSVAGTAMQGPIFASLAGSLPERLTPPLLAQVAEILGRLHADRELARQLGGEPRVCRDTFRETYLERFAGDLEAIAAAPPPFVSGGLIEWLRGEAAELAAIAAASPAFSAPARSPIHGDLWLNNLLVDGDGRCWLLDWDDLTVGDPALDWAMLLGPTASDLSPLRLDDLPDSLAADAAARERLGIYARASLLDWVVDPLADYLDADAAPHLAEQVRREKQRVHQAALERYRQLYPSP